MNASQLLKKLQEFGLTEIGIADELGICQSSVNKIKRGIIKNPSHATARGIDMLYHRMLSKKALLSSKD
jgi:transcriptional regulator with XRE-family HTH domain